MITYLEENIQQMKEPSKEDLSQVPKEGELYYKKFRKSFQMQLIKNFINKLLLNLISLKGHLAAALVNIDQILNRVHYTI